MNLKLEWWHQDEYAAQNGKYANRLTAKGATYQAAVQALATYALYKVVIEYY